MTYRRRLPLFAVVFFHAWLVVVGAWDSRADTGPHRQKLQHPEEFQGGGFRWQASLDSGSGRASSLEISVCDSVDITNLGCRRKVRQKTRNLVESWPLFLSKFSVTFGLISSAPVDKEATAIRLRPLNLSVLSFGKIRMGRQSFKPNVLACYEVPVDGGLLSLLLPSAKDRGYLNFVVERIDTTSKNRNNKVKKSGASCRLRTEISGNYSPWVAGRAPIPAFRKWTYLSSQSLVHAYTMWRFHRAWKDNMKEISQ